MKSKRHLSITRCFLAVGLAVGAAGTQAASGYTISQPDEANVAVGMSSADVQQRLGHPSRIMKYGNQRGRTWIYEVTGAPFGTTEFDVDFGSTGKVSSASERVLGDD